MRVLQLLEQARERTNNNIHGFVHDSTLSAQALELAERIGWERGRFKGHLWSMLSIADRDFIGWEALDRHFRGARQRLNWASAEEMVLLYRTTGRMYSLSQIPDTAALYFDTAQWAAERSGDKRLQALMVYARAHLLRVAERWGDAFRMALTANALAEELEDDLLLAWSYNLSGMIRGRLGDLDGAVKDFTASLERADSMGIYEIQQRNHNNWAYVMEVQGHWSEALEQYRAVRHVATTTGEGMGWLAQIDAGIGYMLVHLDSLDEAEAILGRLRKTKAMVGDPYEQWFNTAWALLQLRRGRYREAVASAHTAFITDQDDENDVVKRDASRILSEAYKALDQPREALKWTEVAHQWEDSVKYRQQASDAIRTELYREMAARAEQDSLDHAEATGRSEVANQQRLSVEKDRRNLVLLIGTAVVLVSLALWRRLRHTRRAKRAVEKERDRSDTLLHNILPSEVAEELKDKGEAKARDIDNVSILFTDFKGFTQMSEQLSAQELVAEINTCFKAFDGIIGKYGVEKIKTIGDAYMAAGGLPAPTERSAVNTVLAALEMQAFMKTYSDARIAQNKPAFEMRVGIHTGPVVAGIVGVKKFQYDIWGDTVNIASRMESSGEVGQVNISEATYRLLVDSEQLSVVGHAAPRASDRSDGQPTTENRQLFTFTPRGKVQAKGKGEMEMYFVRTA